MLVALRPNILKDVDYRKDFTSIPFIIAWLLRGLNIGTVAHLPCESYLLNDIVSVAL